MFSFEPFKTVLRVTDDNRRVENKQAKISGSGCGSVGRAVASDSRDPWFESRHRQNFIFQLYNRKDENKEKEAENGPSLKIKKQPKISGNGGILKFLDQAFLPKFLILGPDL